MKKSYIVGIAGGSAAGKSTFCDDLEKQISDLKTHVFHMGSYFKPENDRPRVDRLTIMTAVYLRE